MTCGIYMIQNLINGKIYIGQGVDIERRWGHHKSELRGNYHGNEHLQHAWNKDGEDNFEFTIICECDENQLNTMEEYYIFELMSYDDEVGYNKNYGGGSGRPNEESRKKLSEALKIAMSRPEVRKKMSENHADFKGENHPMYGKHHSEETRKKLSEYNKGKYVGENNGMYGKHHTEEARNKQSEAKKGKYVGENHPMYGKHHTEEARKKNSEAHKGENNPNYGKHFSEEIRKKMSETHKGKNAYWYGKRGAKCPNSIPLVQLTLEGELVKVYDAAREAARNGFVQSCVSSCCKGERKTHKGYKWMYLSDYEAMKKEGAEK